MIKVMQCWDDGVINDIRLTELLRKHNAKATFNLNPGLHGEERVDSSWVPAGHTGWSHKGFMSGKLSINELTEIYKGFNVASHCMRHETAGRVSDEEFMKAAIDARRFLEDMFQCTCTGFAWPCGCYSDKLADSMLEAGFTYGRTTQYSDHVGQNTHPMLLHSSCHFQDREFYSKYEQVKQQEDGIFYFWGHSYENFDSEGLWDQLEMKLKFIDEDPDAEWYNLSDIDWAAISGIK